MKYIYLSSVLLVSLILVSCGDSTPKFQHIVVKSDRSGVLLDTKEAKILSKLESIFNDKEEAPDADPEYFFIVDITTNDKTVRWQYSENGFIRNIEVDASPIYYMSDFAEFNRTTNIK